RTAACRHRRVHESALAGPAQAAPRSSSDALRRASGRAGGGQGVTSLVEERPVSRSRDATLLELQQLVVDYGYGERRARAVDGIDLAIRDGEGLGLPGESGLGQRASANTVMQILRPPAHITGGRILFQGEDLLQKSAEELRR